MLDLLKNDEVIRLASWDMMSCNLEVPRFDGGVGWDIEGEIILLTAWFMIGKIIYAAVRGNLY